MIVNRKRRRKIRADIFELGRTIEPGILVFSLSPPNSLAEISWMEARCSSSRVYLTDRRFYEDGIAASLTGDVEIRMGKLDCCQWRSQPISSLPPSAPTPPLPHLFRNSVNIRSSDRGGIASRFESR